MLSETCEYSDSSHSLNQRPNSDPHIETSETSQLAVGIGRLVVRLSLGRPVTGSEES